MPDPETPAAAVRGEELSSEFTSSLAIDQRMYREDIAGSIAHVRMLAKQGIVSTEDSASIVSGLETIRDEIESGTFKWRHELEDIHMNVEARLFELIGEPAGRLHTARSRSDQVATDARLYTKRVTYESRAACRRLQRALLDRAEEHIYTYVPGYTHLQKAQPISFGHALMAYYEMLARDAASFTRVIDSSDVLPLGSGSIAGTTFPIDRNDVAEQLGFSRISTNSMDAVSDRDFILDFVYAAAKCMSHLSRLSEDIVIWSSSEFGFVRLSDGYSSGSSMMPQKRNPDFAELVRGKSGRALGSLVSVFTTLKGMPLTYNRDLQEDKPPLMDSADTVLGCLEAARGIVAEMSVDVGRMAESVATPDILATDYADRLVSEHGMPFRDAYIAVVEHIRRGSSIDFDMSEVTVENSVAARDVPGGTAPNRVRGAVMRAYGEIGEARLRGEW